MTLDELRDKVSEIAARIDLRRWPWQIDVRSAQGDEALSIQEHVRERDSGEPTTLGQMSYGLPPAGDEATLVAWIYRQLQKHVLHELAEAFHLDGQRVFDPHRADAIAALEDALAGEPSLDEYAEEHVTTVLRCPPRGDYLTAEEIAVYAATDKDKVFKVKIESPWRGKK